MTALVVKMLSLVTERQSTAVGPNSRLLKVVPQEEITQPVKFLLSGQKSDGAFDDQNPVIHRDIMVTTYVFVIFFL